MRHRVMFALMLIFCLLLLSCGAQNDADGIACTLSVRCDNALAHATLEEETAVILPSDGVMLGKTAVTLSRGASAFDVLRIAAYAVGLHLEFETTPLYGGVYIEGIGNLYALDCGSLSGWVYAVNGVFPNISASAYTLEEGDNVEWIYTCDLGRDAISRYAAGEGSGT